MLLSKQRLFFAAMMLLGLSACSNRWALPADDPGYQPWRGAQDVAPGTNQFGLAGGIALPSARSLPPDSLSAHLVQTGHGKRAVLAWQPLPWASLGLRRDKQDFQAADG